MTAKTAAALAGISALLVGAVGAWWLRGVTDELEPKVFCVVSQETAASRELEVGAIFDPMESGCAGNERLLCVEVDPPFVDLKDC